MLKISNVRTVCFFLGLMMLTGASVCLGQEAVGETSVDKIRARLEDPEFDREWALMKAAGMGDLSSVEFLLENEVSPYFTLEETERTPLHEAAAAGSADVVEALIRSADEMGLLSEVVHAMDSQYRSPLLDAAYQGNISVAGLILDSGALIDTGGSDGLRPLHLAVFQDNEEMVDFLLSRGAYVLARDAEGLTARDYAKSFKNDRLVRKLDLEAERFLQKPVVQGIRACVENYLASMRSGDREMAAAFSTGRHREVIGPDLEPTSFQHVIENIEIHGNEARAIVRITTQNGIIPFFAKIELFHASDGWKVSLTTYSFAFRWEEIR